MSKKTARPQKTKKPSNKSKGTKIDSAGVYC